MDIKDFILIGGGLLIVMVLAHGFWIAYRAKKEPYRLDIVPDLIPDDVDDIERLRGELPNGGARVVGGHQNSPEQESLELQMPTLMNPAAETGDAGGLGERGEDRPPSRQRDALDVALEPIVAEEPKRKEVRQAQPRRPLRERLQAEAKDQRGGLRAVEQPQARERTETQESFELDAQDLSTQIRDKRQEDSPTQAPKQSQELRQNQRQEKTTLRQEGRGRDADQRATQRDRKRGNAPQEEPQIPASVQELLIVHVVAARGQRFVGEDLINALRRQGLRYGEMNIFHRVENTTKAKLYSVANLVEPGTFDLSDVEQLSSPGMSFFLQLPGPDDASGAFEDMLNAAHQVALELGGELRDEQMSVLTGQTREHMRQRIADFARRRLSMRA